MERATALLRVHGIAIVVGDFTAQQRQRVSSVFYILAGADGLGHDYNNSLET